LESNRSTMLQEERRKGRDRESIQFCVCQRDRSIVHETWERRTEEKERGGGRVANQKTVGRWTEKGGVYDDCPR